MIKSFCGCLVALKIAGMVDQTWWIVAAIVLPLSIIGILGEYAAKKGLK